MEKPVFSYSFPEIPLLIYLHPSIPVYYAVSDPEIWIRNRNIEFINISCQST
jgi:hypothetical protein